MVLTSSFEMTASLLAPAKHFEMFRDLQRVYIFNTPCPLVSSSDNARYLLNHSLLQREAPLPFLSTRTGAPTWNFLPWKMGFINFCKRWLLSRMASAMLMDAKQSPVTSYADTLSEEQSRYLSSTFLCYREMQQGLEVSGSSDKDHQHLTCPLLLEVMLVGW